MIRTRRSIPTAYWLIGWKLYHVRKETKIKDLHFKSELLVVLLWVFVWFFFLTAYFLLSSQKKKVRKDMRIWRIIFHCIFFFKFFQISGMLQGGT